MTKTETAKINRRIRVCIQLADNYARLAETAPSIERRNYYRDLVTVYFRRITELEGSLS